MSSKTGLALMVGALLLVTPSALALGTSDVPVAGETPLPADTGTEGLHAVLPGDMDARVEAAGDTVTQTTLVAESLLECQSAVRVPVSLYRGKVTDHREGDGEFSLPVVTGVETVLRQVPVYETIVTTVWEPSGLLGFLEPITQTTTELTGYETVEERVRNVEDVGISLSWSSDYIEWDSKGLEVLLALPVGLDYLRQGLGDLVVSCEPDMVLVSLPDFSAFGQGYDYFHVHIGEAHEHKDGWYSNILDLEFFLMADELVLPEFHRGIIISAGALYQSVVDQATTFAQETGPTPGGDEEATSEAAAEQVATQSAASIVQAPAGTLGALAALASVALAGLGLVARRFLRR